MSGAGEPTPGTGAPRVLMLGKGWFPAELGGLDRLYRDLLEALPAASTRGVVIGPAPDAPPELRAVSSHGAPLPARLLAFWRAVNAAAGEADLIDAHFALYALAPSLIGRARARPWVVHFHGPWAAENVAQGDAAGWRRRVRAGLERRVYHHADRIVVLTGAFRRELVERYGVRPWDVAVIPPGVDLSRFAPGPRGAARARFDLAEGAFVAVCVRRLVPRMGIDDLLDAWAQVVDRLPAGSALLVAGDGVLREALAARAAALGIDGSVRLLGRVGDDELVDLYRAADVGVVPSRDHEGFGLIVAEAAACGTPSIVTAVGGLPEAIGGLDRSLIVAPEDPDALGRRLLAAALEGDLPDRLETERFAQRYSWPKVAGRRAALYRDVVAGRADDRLRVVYLDHVAQLSGGELALLRLLPHLDAVAPHVVLAEDGPLTDRLVAAGVSTEVLPLGEAARDLRKDAVRPGGVHPASVLATARYVLRLARHLRRLQPDLVHANSLKAGVYGVLAGRLAGVPVIWHLRDRLAEDYLPRPAVWGVRRLMRLAVGVVANSESTARTVGGRSVDLDVIRSVIPEIAERPRSPWAERSGPMTFGMVGRIAPWKGQDVFLRAFAMAFGDGEERAVIVGSALFGETDYEASLRDLAAELGIADRVDLRGFREDVGRELATFDVLVHASITPEPFGQVVIEGMAAGLPVIASAGGGPGEILEHGRTGFLHPGGDVAELARLMCCLRDGPGLRARVAAAGYLRAGDYAPAAVAGQLTEVYRRALSRTGRGPRASRGPTSSARRRRRRGRRSAPPPR